MLKGTVTIKNTYVLMFTLGHVVIFPHFFEEFFGQCMIEENNLPFIFREILRFIPHTIQVSGAAELLR